MVCGNARAPGAAVAPDLARANARHAADGRERSLEIQVFLDFICPWCLIGTRNLLAALARVAELTPAIVPTVVWRSVRLLPETPVNGQPYHAFYIARLGSAEAVAARRAHLRRAGRAAGIAFAFDDIPLLPNTAAAHQLLAYACAHEPAEKQAALVERFLTAFFVDCKNIGDPAVLERIGLECGLSHDGVRSHGRVGDHSAGAAIDAMSNDVDSVSGVPFMVFNGKHCVVGAHSVDAMVEMIVESIWG
ncbi:DsbA family oxidoreductase [Burkholderia diffusa]|uniref:DsbA family oxidoreductase n=1 Tax=Burkholderia diffusa TaxID=488732 RepID=UPI001581A779|nr:DsbA family oxidoreductase [Burkholderia diffusa]